ncbi:MAG TPA: LysM peptidoglycan-binding domain-containing protein [Drouetiella sp.]
MPNRDVDRIVHDLQGMRSGQDFSQVASELRDLRQHDPMHFQRNLDQINQSVDMRQLGFPEDFRLAGVNDRNIITTSADGSRLQQRDMQMHVRRDGANPITQERMGERTVTNNPYEHTREYTAQRGDTLWSIARDSAQQDLGRRPTATEINTQVQSIARENNISNPNNLQPGQELRLPITAGAEVGNRGEDTNPPNNRAADLPPGPNMPRDTGAMQPRDGVSNPVAAPGLANDGDAAVGDRTQGVVQRSADGNTTTNYTGGLHDGMLGGFFRTQFNAQQTVDRQGHLLHNQVTYEGSGTTLRLQTPTGPQDLAHVNRVETTYNARSGRYNTTVTTNDGTSYNAVTDRNGRVLTFEQQRGSGY